MTFIIRQDWGDWGFKLFNIPKSIMPSVVDSAGPQFGHLDASILGSAIPITAVMADQSAAVFGSGCFSQGDTKMTLGTGSFLDVNSGAEPHASIKGLVPVVAWKYQGEMTFMAEGSNHDTSSLIEWAKQMSKLHFTEVDSLNNNNDIKVIFAPFDHLNDD